MADVLVPRADLVRMEDERDAALLEAERLHGEAQRLRELLDNQAREAGESLADLQDRRRAARDELNAALQMIRRVRLLHQRTGDGGPRAECVCVQCAAPHPCATIRALNGSI